jgi:hypothetical protein
MFITTAGRTNLHMIETAQEIGCNLDIPYIPRRKQSIKSVQLIQNDDCMVVGKNRLELYPFGQTEPFFFHPNSAMFRIKRLMKGEHDPFLEASGLKKGMTLLDCTLGLAADSIVASFAVGEFGAVMGIEANKYLAYLVKEGLQNWDSGIPEMNGAMKQIQIHQSYSLDFLKNQEDDRFDCVYFDPMFEETVIESDGIKALARFAVYDDITESLFGEAKRVAKNRIILKDHFRSQRFGKFGFNVLKRKSAKFHFGILEK